MHVVPPANNFIFHLIRQLIDQIMIILVLETLAAWCVPRRIVLGVKVYTGHFDISLVCGW
jgi:hypothetical protein